MIQRFKLHMSSFWEEHPALFYGLSFFLGCLFALKNPWSLFVFCLLGLNKKIFCALLCFLLPCLLIQHLYTFPPSGTKISGHFAICSIKRSEKFGEGFHYGGWLKTAEGKMHCRLYSKEFYMPSYTYLVQGRVYEKTNGHYLLKSYGTWERGNKRWSLATWRMKAHEKTKEKIEKTIRNRQAAQFLIGMTTSTIDEPTLAQDLSILGLGHLMSVSGLHFSLLALICHLIFRLFMPYKIEAGLLIVLTTLYFLFIGHTPSIQRAWISCTLMALAQLFEKRSFALNSMGVALVLSLAIDPLAALSPGFRLSFLATGSILLLFTPLERLLRLWIPKQTLKHMLLKNRLWQHGYIALSFFREACALSLAVYLSVLPLMVQMGHPLSLNPLLYNLFFPSLACLALLLFLMTWPFGALVHSLIHTPLDGLMHLIHSPPVLFKTLAIDPLPQWAVACYVTLLFSAGLLFRERKETNRESAIWL